MNQLCNSIGSIGLCRGCGAAELHYSDSCEPCPVNKSAKCLTINTDFQFRQTFEDFAEEKIWRFFRFTFYDDAYLVNLDGAGFIFTPMVPELMKDTGHLTFQTFLSHAKTELADTMDFFLVKMVQEENLAMYDKMHAN